MKKVLALVLAVIMVCTMAMAVTVTTTTTPSGTSSGPYEIATPGSSLKVTLTEATDSAAGDGIHFYLKDGKFVPANNVVTVTFAKGGELVASQGWVKTGTGDTAADYEYLITLKQDLNRAADTKVADIQISAITFKSTGYDLVKVFAPTSAAGYMSFAYGYENVNVVLQEDGTVSFDAGKITTIASLLDKNGKEVNNLNVKLNGMTYSFVKGQKVYSLASAIAAPTTTGTPVATYQNLLNTTAKVVYEKGDKADTTYRVYAKGADGKVLSVVATTSDGVMSFTVPAMSTVIVTTEVLATSGTASTGTTTPAGSTTTNPGTGANDVVGVAAALAVVALVSGAAISLKK